MREKRIKIVTSVVLLLALVVSIFGYIKAGNKRDKIDSKETFKKSSEEGKKEVTGGKVSIVAVGDNLLHLDIIKNAQIKDGYDFKPIYENIKDTVSKADIAMINQETILGGTKLGCSGYPTFNSPQEVGRDLVDIGFDVINHANNHSLDKGIKGINNTLEFWRNYPDTIITGIYESNEDRQKVRVIDKNGVKVAFLSYTYATNGIPVPKDKPYCVSLIDKTLISRDVEEAKKVADAIVVSMHWGYEYNANPSKEQKELAKYLADIGVTLVVGHHPHVLQPAEFIKGKDGNDTLVVYSLGNLISCQNKVPRLLGGLLNVTIEKDKDGIISIKEPSIVPLVTHYDKNRRGFKVYPINKYTKELANKHGISKYDKVLKLEELNKIAAPVLNSILNLGKSQVKVDNPTKEADSKTTVSYKKPDFNRLNNKVEAIAKKYRAVGTSVVVVKNGKIVWTKNRGMADKEKKLAVTDETVYRIASISKTISNMAIMTLYDKGLVKLDGDIGGYLGFRVRNPSYPNTPITLQSILTHTSSISDYGTYSSILGTGKGYPPLRVCLLQEVVPILQGILSIINRVGIRLVIQTLEQVLWVQ